MNIQVKLDETWADDYGTTVAGIIKEELERAVRNEVRSLIKAQQKEIAAKVSAAVRENIKALSAKQLQRITADMLNV